MSRKLIYLVSAITIIISSCGNPKAAEATPRTIANDSELATIISHATNSKSDSIPTTDSTQIPSNEPVKKTFQDSVDAAINLAFKDGNLTSIELKSTQIKQDARIPTNLKRYWETYLIYYSAIVTKSIKKDSDKASSLIEAAKDSAKNFAKSSEDYALYAACMSYSIQFSNIAEISSVSSQATELAEKSLEMNPKNVRAYYVLTSQNFYTPKMFGGMKRVEEFGIKGIACPETLDSTEFTPRWGKPNIYGLLIKFFQQEKRTTDLEKILELARKDYPDQFK